MKEENFVTAENAAAEAAAAARDEFSGKEENLVGNGPSVSPTGGPKKRKRSKLEKRESAIAFGFVSIKIVGFLIFTLVPVFISVVYAFSNMNPRIYPDSILVSMGDPKFWAGFKNFGMLFTNRLYNHDFYLGIFNTFFQLIAEPIQLALGLLLAWLLTQSGVKGSGAFRLLIYMPVVASAVAMGYIWQFMFASNGIINGVLGIRVNWLYGDPWLTRLAIMIKNVWGSMGHTMILYCAGCLAIDHSYYEAAELDGANSWQKFIRITFPMVTPTTFYLLVTGIIGKLQAYNDAVIFAAGSEGAKTVVYFIWKYGLDPGFLRYGIASACSFLLTIVIMILTVIQFKRSNKWVYSL